MVHFQVTEEVQGFYNNWRDFLVLERGFSSLTKDSYQIDVAGFFSFLNQHLGDNIGRIDLINLNSADMRSWLALLRQHQMSSTTIARKLSAIRSFFRFLKKHHQIDNNAVLIAKFTLNVDRLPRPVGQVDTEYVISQIEASAKEEWQGKRDKALLVLIYGCGLRISEGLAFTRAQVDQDIIVVEGKGQKQRIVPKLAVVEVCLREYLACCPYHFEPNDRIFVGARGKPLNPTLFQKTIRQLRVTMGLADSVTPHAFRHSFASHLLNSGADLRSIQELLGHQSLSSTQLYTALDTDRLLELYGKIHPRK